MRRLNDRHKEDAQDHTQQGSSAPYVQTDEDVLQVCSHTQDSPVGEKNCVNYIGAEIAGYCDGHHE